MPELNFSVKWPDNSIDECYSPSTSIKQYLEVGKPYTLTEFVDVAQRALGHASERVEQKFGYHCSSAMDQLARIKQKAATFSDQPDALIEVTDISPR